MLTISHRKQLHAGNVAHIKRTFPRSSLPRPGDHPGDSRGFKAQPTAPLYSENDDSRFGCLSGIHIWLPIGVAIWAAFIWLVFPQL